MEESTWTKTKWKW